MSGSSIAGPLFFFSSASCRSLSSILENVRECRSRNNSESLRKASYQVELLKNGEQVDCPVVFVSFSLRVLVTQIAATAVSVFKRWAIKMLTFWHDAREHTEVGGVTRLGTASLARSNQHLQNPMINTLHLVSFIPTNSQSPHGTLRLYWGSCVGLFLGKVQPFPEISPDDIQAKKYFGTCIQSIFLGGYGLSKQSIVC